MKRMLFLIVFVLIFSCACSDEKVEINNTVNIYNWGEYIDKELIYKFEKETGIKVVYSTFNTNEDMYVKIKKGGSNYDVVIPSDYMIERMIKEDMLKKIDYSKINNFKNVDKKYLNHAYDPDQKYSVPYFWGTLGIVYNKNMVKDKVDSWDILWNEKYKRNIIMLDSSRDSLCIALIKLGYSPNSKKEAELNEAKELLKGQYDLVYAYLVDQTKHIMINEEAALAVMYSGDAVEAIDENENLEYVVPKEGSNIWFDSMVIPKNAKNVENAYKFIDFMLNEKNMAKNAEYVGYSVPSSKAKKLLPKEVKDSKLAYPSDNVIKKLIVFKDPGKYIRLYDEIWQEVKNK